MPEFALNWSEMVSYKTKLISHVSSNKLMTLKTYFISKEIHQMLGKSSSYLAVDMRSQDKSF